MRASVTSVRTGNDEVQPVWQPHNQSNCWVVKMPCKISAHKSEGAISVFTAFAILVTTPALGQKKLLQSMQMHNVLHDITIHISIQETRKNETQPTMQSMYSSRETNIS